MTLLQPQQLREALVRLGFQHAIELICLDQVDSTQRFLKDYPETPAWVLCTAETQTQGRGRLGRHWHSEETGHIYASIRLSAVPQQGLSLVVGLAMLAALQRWAGENSVAAPVHAITLKWPNDLIWQGKKLAGILIEVLSSSELIVGIGLNVVATTYEGACSLSEILDQVLDRHEILARILVQLEAYLARFTQRGLGDFMAEWERVDGLKGQQITVQKGTVTQTGVACGINLKGELMFKDMSDLRALESGEVILKPSALS